MLQRHGYMDESATALRHEAMSFMLRRFARGITNSV